MSHHLGVFARLVGRWMPGSEVRCPKAIDTMTMADIHLASHHVITLDSIKHMNESATYVIFVYSEIMCLVYFTCAAQHLIRHPLREASQTLVMS